MGDTIWTLIYLGLAVVFVVGEIFSPGSFILAPFALGAMAGAIGSFAGLNSTLSLLVFLAVSAGAFVALRPLARHIDTTIPEEIGVGANRLLGMTGIVTKEITGLPGESGMVKISGEVWGALSEAGPLPVNMSIKVVKVSGTRLLVEPLSSLNRDS